MNLEKELKKTGLHVCHFWRRCSSSHHLQSTITRLRILQLVSVSEEKILMRTSLASKGSNLITNGSFQLIRYFSVSGTHFADWKVRVSPKEDLSKSQLRQRTIFNEIFDSVLVRTENTPHTEVKKLSLSKVLGELFEPAPTRSSSPLAQKSTGMSVYDESQLEAPEEDNLEWMRDIKSHISAIESDKALLDYFNAIKVGNRQGDPDANSPVLSASEYNAVAVECMKTALEFQSPIVALHVFKRMKTMSEGDSKAYNVAVFIRWEYYRDLAAIVDLLSEMTLKGIPGDVNTVKLLGRVLQQAYEAKQGVKEGIPTWNTKTDMSLDFLVNFRRSQVDRLAKRPKIH